MGVAFVDDQDAGGDAGAVEQVGGQADDGLEVPAFDEVLADGGFGVAAEEHAVGEDAGADAGGLEAADDVQEVGVVALFVGRDTEAGKAVVRVGLRSLTMPVVQRFVREGGIGDDVVEGFELAGVRALVFA